ncbi:hypothetical protein B0T17DRAFT_386119 [Bombardia bombarda]|uniref:Uncharacterized protein n=1 Tax=Bombardia bombarda TaxID=252184 RepID=A0AA39T2I1_9PEZI|nr:hypothetical protein B0T17DRAFT_386119 [Bombardia bombarda]
MQRKQFEDSKTIQRLMEQLDGKRNLWVEFHKSPDERAQAWEMFSRGQPPVTESTSTAEDDLQEWQPQGTTKDHGYPMSSIAAMPPISGSQHNARSVSQAPHGEYGASRNHPKAHSVSSYDAELERTRGVPATSDHGSPRPRNAGTSALVVASKPGDEAAALLWNADFAKLFDVILRFCQKYTGSSSHKGFYQGVPEQNPSSWRNICEVLYPQSQMGASSNQAHLLTDDSARPYFVQRLIIQMITVGVFEYEGLSGFNDRTNKELQDIDSRLAATEVFKPHERLALVDRRAEIVKNLFSHPSWKAFYAYKKNNFLAKLRPTVGAIIPTNLKSDLREQMSWDLSEATDEAWKLAAKLWQARVTFKYIWYAYGEKFQVDNHHALNSNLDAAILEQRQARLKLAATPAVILRNDQTMAIMAKRVMKADVLVMS